MPDCSEQIGHCNIQRKGKYTHKTHEEYTSHHSIQQEGTTHTESKLSPDQLDRPRPPIRPDRPSKYQKWWAWYWLPPCCWFCPIACWSPINIRNQSPRWIFAATLSLTRWRTQGQRKGNPNERSTYNTIYGRTSGGSSARSARCLRSSRHCC